jgi:hypothetical protein
MQSAGWRRAASPSFWTTRLAEAGLSVSQLGLMARIARRRRHVGSVGAKDRPGSVDAVAQSAHAGGSGVGRNRHGRNGFAPPRWYGSPKPAPAAGGGDSALAQAANAAGRDMFRLDLARRMADKTESLDRRLNQKTRGNEPCRLDLKYLVWSCPADVGAVHHRGHRRHDCRSGFRR